MDCIWNVISEMVCCVIYRHFSSLLFFALIALSLSINEILIVLITPTFWQLVLRRFTLSLVSSQWSSFLGREGGEEVNEGEMPLFLIVRCAEIFLSNSYCDSRHSERTLRFWHYNCESAKNVVNNIHTDSYLWWSFQAVERGIAFRGYGIGWENGVVEWGLAPFWMNLCCVIRNVFMHVKVNLVNSTLQLGE